MEIIDIVIFIVACIVSYLLGGVSIARFITSKGKEGDISNQGSGNPGTMNMLRTHGIVMGLFTLFCDALKGVAPALFGLLYFGELISPEIGYIAGEGANLLPNEMLVMRNNILNEYFYYFYLSFFIPQ